MANPKIEVEIGAITDKLKKGVDGSILSLNQLEKEAQDLNKALANATDVKDIVRLNSQLANTRQAMQNLRSAGVQPLTQATAQFNSVGVDFARIIQDAPFGIIGVGNNITQLASSFQNARNQGQSFTKILGSIFSSGNLLVLGISAITTALTLYSMNANKGAENTDKLKEAYDDLADSAENAASKIAAIRFTEDKIQEEIDRVLGIDSSFQIIGASAEQLTEIVNRAFSRLDKTQLDAFKSGLDELANDQLRKVGNELGLTRKETISFINSIKDNDQAFEELNPNIRDAVSAYLRLSNQVELTGKQLDFYKDKQDKLKVAQKEYNKTIDEAIQNAFDYESAILSALTLQRQLDPNRLFQNATSRLTGTEGDSAFSDPASEVQAKIAASLSSFDPTEKTTLFKGELESLLEKVDELSGAFSGLGSLIGKAFNNAPLGQFVGEFLRFSAKLIAANFKIASANAITGATQSATATGPAAAITLPAFIAGAVGLVASAFAAIGGGGGRSVGSSGVGGGVAQTFGGSGSTGLSFDRSLALTGEFRVKGQDLVYVFNEASSRNAKG